MSEKNGGILFRDDFEQYADSYAFQTEPRWGFTYDNQAYAGHRGEIENGQGVAKSQVVYVNARWKFDYEIGFEWRAAIRGRGESALSFPYVLKDGYVSFKIRRGPLDAFAQQRSINPREFANPPFRENKEMPGFQIMVGGINLVTSHFGFIQRGNGRTGFEEVSEDFRGDDMMKWEIPVGRLAVSGKEGSEKICLGTSLLARNPNYPKLDFSANQWHTVVVRCVPGSLATVEIDGTRIGQIDSATLTGIQFTPWFSIPGYYLDDVEIFYAKPPAGILLYARSEPVLYAIPPQEYLAAAVDNRNWWPRIHDMEVLDIPDEKVEMLKLSGGHVTLGNPYKHNYGPSFFEDQVPSPLKVKVNPFLVSKHPVTYGQFRRVLNWALKHGYTFEQHGHNSAMIFCDAWCYDTLDPRHPMASYNWYAQIKFCNALSEMEGKTPCYYTDGAHREVYRQGYLDLDVYDVKWDANGYRIPTEAEWSYYVRGGSSDRNPWGNTMHHPKFAWQNLCDMTFPGGDGLPRLGLFAPNGYGLFDVMQVYETVWNWPAFWNLQQRDNPKGGDSMESRDAIDYLGRGNTLGALWGHGLWHAGAADNDWNHPLHMALGGKHDDFNSTDIYKIGAFDACRAPIAEDWLRVVRADPDLPRGSYSGVMWEKKDPATVPLPVNIDVQSRKLPESGDFLRLVEIPAGKFRMGGERSKPNIHSELWLNEIPVREVTLRPFAMGKTEVTRGQWTKVHAWGKAHGYEFQPIEFWSDKRIQWDKGGISDEHPITYISWYDAVRWCNAASEMEGRKPCYYLDAEKKEVFRKGYPDLEAAQVDWRANGYRLPTEAEWEYACRGGTTAKHFWGDDLNPEYGQHHLFRKPGPIQRDYDFFTKVTEYRPNQFGLYDMLGNATEWCWDWLGPYDAKAVDNPMGCNGAMSLQIHRDLHAERTSTYGGYPKIQEVNLVEGEFAIKGVHEKAEEYRGKLIKEKPNVAWPTELKLRHQRRVLRGGLEFYSAQRYGNDPLFPKYDQGFRVAVSK